MTEKCFFSGYQFQAPFLAYLGEMDYRLFSCHEQYLSSTEKTAQLYKERGLRMKEVILDSGAFTAWSKGRIMSFQDVMANYWRGIEAIQPYCDKVWLINLDVIPGVKGRAATEGEIQRAMDASDENQRQLKKSFGDIILPVFHQDEPFERLSVVKELCAEGRYICVSPRNDLHEGERREWAQRVHRLTQGFRTHGLAATGASMLLSVPWHSVDSASWVHIAAYGHIMFAVDGAFKMITVSSKSPKKDDLDNHYDTFSDERKRYWANQAMKLGFDIEALKESFPLRCALNMLSTKILLTQERRQVLVQTALFGI